MFDLLLSTAFFPPVEYCWAIKNCNSFAIENHENYRKQTYRNRMEIATEHGRQVLSVPVVQTHEKMPIQDVRVDYKTPWQRHHWKTITAAYNNSPYFFYYEDYFRPFFENQTEFLLDLNNQILETCLKLLKISKLPLATEKFQLSYPDEVADFRFSLHPKLSLPEPLADAVSPYDQPFASINGFLPHLSVLDFLSNKGSF